MLYGRGTELEEIGRLLSEVRDGGGRALLISGEAGIGKTALLAAAREAASGIEVIEAVGIEAEANLPFAALSEIAAPLLDGLAGLPEPQSAAIEAALALSPAPRSALDRFAVCAGFLGLLRAHADRGPLLVVVDDAQWLDSSSAECLGYAGRRLQGSGVGLLAAARDGAGRGAPLGGHLPEELTPSRLGREDAMALLRSRADQISAPAAESLLEAAAGNPLALIELPSLLTREQLLDAHPIEPLPIPDNGLREAFEQRLADQAEEVRSALVVAASSIDRALPPVVAACRELGIDDEALDRAESAGLVKLGGNRISFSHPLLRALVYESAPGGQRRRAHRALAARTDPDARAWHLAAGVLGPDPEVAEALDAAAQRAGARGAYGAASDALGRSAQLSEEPLLRTHRLLAAGLTAALGGAYDRAVTILEPLSNSAGEEMRPYVRHLLAMVTLVGGNRLVLSNHAMLSEEAERVSGSEPALAAMLHADAGVAAVVAGDCRLALASGEAAFELLEEGAPISTRCQALSIVGMGRALAGRIDEATEALDAAGELLPQLEPRSPAAESSCFSLHARISTGQARLLHDEALALAPAARDSKTLGLLPYYTLLAADSAYRIGDWDSAQGNADEAVQVADECEQRGPLSIALVIRARLRAARGDSDGARADLDRGVELAEPIGMGSTVIWARSALGFLELGLGHNDEAIEQLELVGQLAELAGLEEPVIVPWAPDLVEAYSRAGRREEASRLAGSLAEQAARSGVPLALALAARCEGLVRSDSFDAAFERASELHQEADSPFELARTMLSWGTRLHRARRRVEARKRLRAARRIFEDLGARPWIDTVSAQLRAAGAIKREPVGDPDELTAQEIRVALAVSRGATNREVAAELFLSPKTIEFHLGRVYRKLAINSRTELAAIAAEGGLGGRRSALSDAGQRIG